MSRHRKLKVGILTTPDTSASTLFGFYDVLSTVGLGWEAFVSREESSPRFDVQLVAENDQPVQCGPARVMPTITFAESSNLDIVIVASFAVPGLVLRNHSDTEFEWLNKVSSEGSVIGAFCTASSILAAAELLNGREATTYWAYRDVVKLHYPRVNWRAEKNLCITGDNGNIVTSGGATGWEELALYLVTRFCGMDHARQTAKFWLIPDRGGSQRPYSVLQRAVEQELLVSTDNAINEARNWLKEHYSERNPISAVIEHIGIPTTTFSRRFKKITGMRPMDYVHDLRIDKAKEILESSNANIDEIGHTVGYDDPASFRRIFKRSVDLTPSVYRKSFGQVRFNRYLG